MLLSNDRLACFYNKVFVDGPNHWTIEALCLGKCVTLERRRPVDEGALRQQTGH